MTPRITRQASKYPVSKFKNVLNNKIRKRENILYKPGLRTLLLKKRFHTNFKRFLTHIDSIANLLSIPQLLPTLHTKTPLISMHRNSTAIAHYHFSQNTTISLFLENTVIDHNYSVHRINLLPDQNTYILYHNASGNIVTIHSPFPELIDKANIAEQQLALL